MRAEVGNVVWPKSLQGAVLGFVLFHFGLIRIASIQHWLQDTTTGIDEPIVDLQKCKVCLGSNLSLFIFSRIGMHNVLEEPRFHNFSGCFR